MARLSWSNNPGTEQVSRSVGDPEVEIALSARTDRKAFAPLYDRYVDPVYRYCLRRLGSRDAAEDATAQTFAKALAALPSFRPDAPTFRSWLFAIAHNVILDEVRARRPQATLEAASELIDPGVGPEDLAERADDLRQLQALLEKLPESHRALVELRLAGLSDVEIAAIQDRSRKAVNVAQYRALLQLRSLVDSESKGSGGRDG